MKKKLLSMMLAAAMAVSMAVPSFAATTVDVSGGTGTVPVVVSTESAKFSVTVPTGLPVSIDEDGNPTTEPANIINNGTGPVKITNLEIVGQNSWETVDFDSTNLATDKIGTKHVAVATYMSKNKTDATKHEKTTGADQITFNAANWETLNGGSTMSVGYDAYIPLQSEALSNVTVANLIFTIAWDTAV